MITKLEVTNNPWKGHEYQPPKRVTRKKLPEVFFGETKIFLFQLDATEILDFLHQTYMDVSKNSGTPKSSSLIRFSIINHPFWGTSIFGNTHIHPVLRSPDFWHRIAGVFSCWHLLRHILGLKEVCFLCVFFTPQRGKNWGFIRIYYKVGPPTSYNWVYNGL